MLYIFMLLLKSLLLFTVTDVFHDNDAFGNDVVPNVTPAFVVMMFMMTCPLLKMAIPMKTHQLMLICPLKILQMMPCTLMMLLIVAALFLVQDIKRRLGVV